MIWENGIIFSKHFTGWNFNNSKYRELHIDVTSIAFAVLLRFSVLIVIIILTRENLKFSTKPRNKENKWRSLIVGN